MYKLVSSYYESKQFGFLLKKDELDSIELHSIEKETHTSKRQAPWKAAKTDSGDRKFEIRKRKKLH